MVEVWCKNWWSFTVNWDNKLRCLWVTTATFWCTWLAC